MSRMQGAPKGLASRFFSQLKAGWDEPKRLIDKTGEVSGEKRFAISFIGALCALIVAATFFILTRPYGAALALLLQADSALAAIAFGIYTIVFELRPSRKQKEKDRTGRTLHIIVETNTGAYVKDVKIEDQREN